MNMKAKITHGGKRMADNKKSRRLYTEDLIIWCAGHYGQEVSDHIKNNGGSIWCFCDVEKGKQGKFINNIPVYRFEDAYKKNPNALIVVANSNYAECIRIANKLEMYGYSKNISYFIALEMEIEGIFPLMKAPFCLEDRKIILLGPQYLCECFVEWAEGQRENIIVCKSEQDIGLWKKEYPIALWIPLYRGSLEIEHNERVLWYRKRLLKENILFTEWFLNHFDYCANKNLEEIDCDKNVSVKKVLFNILVNNAGNTFIDGVIDSHPNILYFGLEMYVWTNNIWDIIKNSKREMGLKITDRIIEKIQDYTMDAWNKNIDKISFISLPDRSLIWLEKYRSCLYKRMGENRQYTEREIFVNMHLAWKEANGQSVKGDESVIYMDIHGSCAPWETYYMLTRWLEQMGFEVVLLQMIRRPYSQSASSMKAYIAQGKFRSDTALAALTFVAYEIIIGGLRKYPILRLRFEDVKQYPEIVLRKLCKKLQIPWNESMLRTTSAGRTTEYICEREVISGYHMKSVWYSYDEFFDAFDKFRLDILCSSKCEAYGYPHVPKEKYILPTDLLVELFVLPFQFEKYLVFENDQARKQFRVSIRERCRKIIYEQENKENVEELFCFGAYLDHASEGDLD